MGILFQYDYLKAVNAPQFVYELYEDWRHVDYGIYYEMQWTMMLENIKDSYVQDFD